MIDLIKKYSLLLIVGIVLSRITVGILLFVFPDLLTSEVPDGRTFTLSGDYLSLGFEYMVNVAFIFLLAKDLKNEKINSPLILIMTFFSAFIGIVLFLLLVASNKNNHSKIKIDE